jgi:hypothetical protein
MEDFKKLSLEEIKKLKEELKEKTLDYQHLDA